MLSATPHDGKSESFASLMNMLDPTAIANPKEYKLEDFADKKLVVRRFKKDVKDQMAGEFPEREIKALRRDATSAEEEVYRRLLESKFRDDDDEDASTTKVICLKSRWRKPCSQALWLVPASSRTV